MVAEKTQTYTIAEYQQIQDLPENKDHILELIEGEIIEKMPSFTPSKIGMRIGRLIGNFVDEHDLGFVTGEAGGYIMSPDTTFIPDVGYISKIRLPEEPSREVPVPPDLAVEIKSPTDSKRDMRKKAEKYITFGTTLVWLVFPDEQAIEVYEGKEDVKTLGLEDIVTGGSVLPGFELAVSDIFR